jgi:hypothetical protein
MESQLEVLNKRTVRGSVEVIVLGRSMFVVRYARATDMQSIKRAVNY